MKVLLTGASGQVGAALQASVPSDVELRATTHAQLDIGDGSAVGRLVAPYAPSLIVNAAAYTAVDKAESEPALAFAINADGPRHLAAAAGAVPGCRLVHLSTDYVFDGDSGDPYRPGDPVNPMRVYGRGKLAGDQGALSGLAE